MMTSKCFFCVCERGGRMIEEEKVSWEKMMEFGEGDVRWEGREKEF